MQQVRTDFASDVCHPTAPDEVWPDMLKAEIVAEFHPSRPLPAICLCRLAGVLERLEITKPGNVEWQRLVSVKQSVGETLQATRSDASRISRLPSRPQATTH